MSGLSDGRISHLAHLILDSLQHDGLADIPNTLNMLKETKEALKEFDNDEDRLDQLVRKKIHSLSRPIPPGSREWDILYRKYLEKELKKR